MFAALSRVSPHIGLCIATALLGSLGPNSALADDVLTRAGCDGCHLLAPPAPEARNLAAFEARRAPDLFYAGSKFRPEWLHVWLQNPKRIRPAGLHPARNAQTIGGQDQLDASRLEPHPAVLASEVEALVDALIALDWQSERLPDTLQLRPVPRMLARLNFVKFKGCASCHRSSEDFGGLSGPELYTAWARMRPEFLWSYIADPQAWDPVAPMPGYALVPGEVGKLVQYLRQLSEARDAAE